MRHSLTVVALCAVLGGCRDQEMAAPPKTPATTPTGSARTAFLSVSNLTPTVGSTIVVAGKVDVGDSLPVASFKVRLDYDQRALYYLGAVDLPGMMRVVNAQGSEIVVAGASGSGSNDGRLFAMEFRVDDPAGLESLALFVDELNDVNFNSGLSSLKKESRLRLDRKLTGGHVSPP
jgi:hypothetical protein